MTSRLGTGKRLTLFYSVGGWAKTLKFPSPLLYLRLRQPDGGSGFSCFPLITFNISLVGVWRGLGGGGGVFHSLFALVSNLTFCILIYRPVSVGGGKNGAIIVSTFFKARKKRVPNKFRGGSKINIDGAFFQFLLLLFKSSNLELH